MSGGANKDFIANPADWLSKNILIIEINEQGGPVSNAGAVLTVNLAKAADTATKEGGGSVSVYKLKRGSANPSSHSHQFQAYFLPWTQNGTQRMTLDQDNVDWFFTDTLNGCTFAAGPGEFPKVCHLNYQIQNTRIDINRISDACDGEFPGGVRCRLSKNNYMDNDGFAKVTVLGFKKNHVWTFLYQKRMTVSLFPPKWTLWKKQPVTIQ